MRTLLIDNYDSYTYNLFQLMARVNGHDPVVVHNDDPILRRPLDGFDAIVISPGPGNPRTGRDTGHVGELLRTTPLPVLGVCLGHQTLAHVEGGEVIPAPQPRHGHLTEVTHDGEGLFDGLPQGFRAVRYHSLRVAEPLPGTLTATAWAEDGVVMSLAHNSLPRWGVQFHPESIATDHGHRLLANFRDLALRPPSATVSAPAKPIGAGRGVEVRVLPWAADPGRLVETLPDGADLSWLDSSLVQPGLSRFSFLAGFAGPLAETLTYRVGEGRVRVTTPGGPARDEPGDIFGVLADRLAALRTAAPPDLPFDFACGYVGYFGYELKADCGAARRHTAREPDAVWTLADRLVVVDHEGGRTYLLTLHDGSATVRAANAEWTETMAALPALLPADRDGNGNGTHDGDPAYGPEVVPMAARGREQYLADVAECRRLLAAGESYEICLTDKVHVPFGGDPVELYRRLRAVNPAPFAALLRYGGLAVLSSSPERFLRIGRDGLVQAKPIKGTAPRSADPLEDGLIAGRLAADPKTRAENLMIVDLLRNDLGRACEVGSVEVPSLMAVESYATVHQLVSTVTGRLRPGVSAIDCVRACFPGGSMTGAPKLRTMELIDAMEREARGVYSGALGWLGLDGTADLSIVIRTAVHWDGELTVGAGGAVVYGSTPEGEYAEMLLKASATLRALTGVPTTVGG